MTSAEAWGIVGLDIFTAIKYVAPPFLLLAGGALVWSDIFDDWIGAACTSVGIILYILAVTS